MSLLKAKLPSGEIVFAEQGEELRGKDLRCPYCGAKLIIRHFPERPEYLFAVKEGESTLHLKSFLQRCQHRKILMVVKEEEQAAKGERQEIQCLA